MARLGDPEAIVALKETAQLKHDTATVEWPGSTRPGRNGVHHQAGPGHRDDHRRGRPACLPGRDEVYGRPSRTIRSACLPGRRWQLKSQRHQADLGKPHGKTMEKD